MNQPCTNDFLKKKKKRKLSVGTEQDRKDTQTHLSYVYCSTKGCELWSEAFCKHSNKAWIRYTRHQTPSSCCSLNSENDPTLWVPCLNCYTNLKHQAALPCTNSFSENIYYPSALQRGVIPATKNLHFSTCPCCLDKRASTGIL